MLRHLRLLLVFALCFTRLGSAALPPSSAGVVHQPSVYGTARSASKHHRQSKVSDEAIISPDRIHDPVLWHDPGNIAAKDLLHGLGGAEDEPRPPFTFLREDLKGSNPKFDARDANGVTWRVKLGTEARPEVVASRLLWAVGYYTDVDYNLREAVVRHLRMARGSGRDRRGDLVLKRPLCAQAGGRRAHRALGVET